MTTYSQRYSDTDDNTAGQFVFHTNASGQDVPVTKLMYGADGADPTVVTATVGMPVVLLAGSAAIGKLAANAGVTIGAVEIASAQTVGITAASLPLPSGAATSANQVTELASLASIDGKLTVCNTGSVTIASSALPSGASTSANQTLILANLSSIDGHVDGLETSLASVDAKITACNTGAVVIASSALPSGAATAARQDTGNTSLSSIDGKITACNTGAVVISSGTITNLSQLGGTAIAMGTGVRSAGTQRVTIATDDVVPASQSGTWTVGISASQTLDTVTTVNTVTTVTTLTGGGVAHDGVDSGNPIKVGAYATTALSGVTLVADADRTRLVAGVDGVQITRPHCNLEDVVSGNASNTDGTSTQCIAAQSSGIKTYLTTIILTNTSSSNIYVEIKDGTTVKLTIPVPANGGAVCNLPVPIGGTAATAWNFDPSAAASTVYCSMVGFKSKV